MYTLTDARQAETNVRYSIKGIQLGESMVVYQYVRYMAGCEPETVEGITKIDSYENIRRQIDDPRIFGAPTFSMLPPRGMIIAEGKQVELERWSIPIAVDGVYRRGKRGEDFYALGVENPYTELKLSPEAAERIVLIDDSKHAPTPYIARYLNGKPAATKVNVAVSSAFDYKELEGVDIAGLKQYLLAGGHHLTTPPGGKGFNIDIFVKDDVYDFLGGDLSDLPKNLRLWLISAYEQSITKQQAI